jgi:hypothetical protein
MARIIRLERKFAKVISRSDMSLRVSTMPVARTPFKMLRGSERHRELGSLMTCWKLCMERSKRRRIRLSAAKAVEASR